MENLPPLAVECLTDMVTHELVLLTAIEHMKVFHRDDPDNRTFWEHEEAVVKRMAAQAKKVTGSTIGDFT